ATARPSRRPRLRSRPAAAGRAARRSRGSWPRGPAGTRPPAGPAGNAAGPAVFRLLRLCRWGDSISPVSGSGDNAGPMRQARTHAILSTLAVASVIVGWTSSLAVPLTDAVRGARDPADFIRDYVTARARLEGGRGAPPSGESANDLGERLGTPR